MRWGQSREQVPLPGDWTQVVYHPNPELARQHSSPPPLTPRLVRKTPHVVNASPGSATGRGAALRKCWTAPETGPLWQTYEKVKAPNRLQT